MKKNLQALLFTLTSAVLSTVVHGEAAVKAGKEKSAACAGCHGENGNSMVATFPKLAQQHPSYLIKQLTAFKEDTRNDPMMSSVAKGLSEQDMAEIAAFYSTQHISQNDMPVLPDDDEDTGGIQTGEKETIQSVIAKGSDLYRNGNLSSEVSACIACHGPHGEGNKPAAFPSIKQQHADYLIKTLNDFKSGVRSNNPENMMHMIAQKMTDEEIKAVAYYISMMK